mmetsp:Transcript_29154/g.32251  ORF Transcript_29154/g.32251 Transcript_29154/m.32251 type:complete len:641 (-) Transcript_29154:112-2034(-)|eukprot:CAMPEP_0194136530 /NCGR_PEP_ID=MMETSP0152-20130528/6543_1 /TAXON_ID=1049557 /ORGANISM="Thalassiothrix antarctica, Strain L6-D1" /LENGTH=640 /DNA_ID=CAMNT_0038833231 /DNA_START=43 /DNA_END=1965 /DNA_ORIENTATION=-
MENNKVDLPIDNTIVDNNASEPESDTVPRQVLWRREHRKYTDKWWGVIYFLSYVAFLGCGITITTYSNDRFDVVKEGNMTRYYVSSHFEAEVKQCCESIDDDIFTSTYSLCEQLREGNGDRRRRFLEETASSSFREDEGIFDAFLDAPEIIVGILSLTIVACIVWIILLRFFSKPIVILTELAKIAICIYLGIKFENLWIFAVAVGILAYDIYAREQIIFAAEIISYSVVAFKANPTMFLALIFLQLLFVGNALLFVFFFAKSFNMAKVSDNCNYTYPEFLDNVLIYMSLAYLWTIFLFHRMRLSVIATVVGSWYFHPGDKAGVLTALLNTTTTSFGTLSVAALISTIVEKILRMTQNPCRNCLNIVICGPFYLTLWIFSLCLGTLIKMLTKYAVILHVWTGLPFVGSAKKVTKILSRHFKGGFVTEITSQSVLKLASYLFSLSIGILTWFWFDDKFNINTLTTEEDDGMDNWEIYSFIFAGLFLLWFPILGLYIIILVDRGFRAAHADSSIDIDNTYWIPPLAGIFVGCISMMFFLFLSEIFIDTIDTLFLGFAVDKDNDDISNLELAELVKKLPAYIGPVTTHQEEDSPVIVASIIPETPSVVATAPMVTATATTIKSVPTVAATAPRASFDDGECEA